MEAATPLHQSTVRVVGERVVVDGLVVEDDCAVRLLSEAPDAARLLLDAIEVGARILDREQVGANADFVKAEFEKAARDLDAEFVDRARRVAEKLDKRLDDAFGPEHGVVVTALKRHFGDESSEAVQHKVRDVVRDMAGQMREDLRKQFASEGDENPLASFHRVQLAVAKQVGEQHAVQLNAVREQVEAMRLEVERLRADKEKLEEVNAEREKGTAKGRSFEEVVHEALDRIALPQGDDCEAVGDFLEGTGKKGDVVVGIGACHGPARGRIVFEVKTSKLSRPKALEELEGCKAERNADFAVLVVPSEDKVPAKMLPLREYNGDKLIVAFDPEEGSPLGLQVAYALARARVLMAKGGGDGVDTPAVRDAVERAVGLMEEVRRIKQQLTASKTSIDKAAEIVQTMADGVRSQLAEISGLIDRAEAAAAAGEPGQATVAEADTAPASREPEAAPPPAGTERPALAAPRLRDELAAALSSSHEADGGQSSLL
jgi:TolA-binding protein